MPRMRVAKSIEINAAAQQVFDTVADFRTWPKWSPWLCVEPDARITISTPADSVGSTYAWDGELVGAGELEHRQLDRGRMIRDVIRFRRPFRSTASVDFDLESTGSGCRLTWRMDGSLPWFLFFLCSQMETFIGMDYERGLRMLKEFIETGRVLSRTVIRGVEPVGPMRMAGIRKTCRFEEVLASMAEAMSEATEKFAQHGLPMDGRPTTVYRKVDFKKRTFDFVSGFILADPVQDVPSELASASCPAIRALVVEHHGRYDHLSNSWNAGYHFARCKDLKLSKLPAFEIYTTDPGSTPDENLQTDIYIPLR